jgi:hypothetical protein
VVPLDGSGTVYQLPIVLPSRASAVGLAYNENGERGVRPDWQLNCLATNVQITRFGCLGKSMPSSSTDSMSREPHSPTTTHWTAVSSAPFVFRALTQLATLRIVPVAATDALLGSYAFGNPLYDGDISIADGYLLGVSEAV